MIHTTPAAPRSRSPLVLPLLALLVFLAPALVRAADDSTKKAAEEALARMRDRDPAIRLEGVREGAAIQETEVASRLAELLDDPDEPVRLAAIDALGSRKDSGQKRRAAEALARRLTFLDKKGNSPDELTRIVSALDSLAQPESIEALLDMRTTEDQAIAEARLMAVADVPVAEAIDGLIAFMSKGRNRGRGRQRTLAAKALRYATGINLGEKPDAWRAWWREHRDTFDFEAAAAKRADDRRAAEEKRRKKEERQRKREGKAGKKGDDGGDDGKGGGDAPPDDK